MSVAPKSEALLRREASRSMAIDRKSTRLNSSHSLRDALPISIGQGEHLILPIRITGIHDVGGAKIRGPLEARGVEVYGNRSEEHTSELQSLPTRRSSDLHRSGRAPDPSNPYHRNSRCRWRQNQRPS